MRVIETVAPIQVPKKPRVFTIECDEHEIRNMLDWYWFMNDEYVADEMDHHIWGTLANSLC